MTTRAEGQRWLWWKRPLDLVILGVVAVPALFVALVVAAMVRARLGSPVLFRQDRPGLRGRPFGLVKFRTMQAEGAGAAVPASDAQRVTAFGTWLRSTSLDELPQLWNVLRGEMSFVGPRPLLMEYLPLYSPRQARRMEVLPGLTGWAQVNGRNGADWEARFTMDNWYVDHASPQLDLRILALTVGLVIRREGVAQPGQATMERFRGTD